MDTTTLIGVVGAGVILVLFLLNQLNKLKNNNFWYDFWNFIGSALLCVYAYLLDSIPFIILNFIWAVFSLRDVLKYLVKK